MKEGPPRELRVEYKLTETGEKRSDVYNTVRDINIVDCGECAYVCLLLPR